ncbi:DUF3231 family protein [Ornithinibacillus halotolerans]|uniref:DUF3231 family protein n=1 Tax=Ornithinibacillus halotolerans TaxID=1274357 RepID=A0A916RUI7_9BACI|nr:DUF3231 family protein [Ornithinibacillus halotolerans]GGA71136.1 hypothetical protein GCM10008025_13790 [Ornithinibacillus halotolerans]
MEIEHNPRLTAVELSQVWNAYMSDSLSVCILKYFQNCVEDQSIKEIVQSGAELSELHLEKLKVILEKEDFPTPIGFDEKEDVHIQGPKLYSDDYILNYMRDMASIGMNTYGTAIGFAAREDVHHYFSTSFAETNQLHKRAKNLMLEKGTYVRGPYIQAQAKPEFVKKQSFLTGWFGERRPLTAMEITSLYANVQRNLLGASTLLGFAQVAQSKEVKKYLLRGKDIAKKHVEVFGSILTEEDLPTPMSWNSEVTDATDFVFSDKLMMFHTTALIAVSVGYYGIALARSMRRDISTHYTRLIAEIMKYAEDGTNIMIDNGWLEQPPTAPNRKDLADR